jgi:hypothetical protein
MREILSRRSASLILLALSLWLTPTSARAQTVTVLGPDSVTVRAVNVPIATLLAELAGLAGMDRMEIDPVDRGHLVTLTLENVPVRVAMLIALRSSAADFIFTEKRLRVGAGGKVIETVRPAAVAAQHRDRDRTPAAVAVAPIAPQTRDRVDDPRDAGPIQGFGGASSDQTASAGSADQPEMNSASTNTLTEFEHGLSVRDVPFVVKEDSAVVSEPGYVPYKNRPDVKRLRMSIDPATIP